jgi:molybdenum cofactor cytidylyltransferase
VKGYPGVNLVVNPVVNPAIIVLASGRGERFLASGGRASKLQAMLAGRTVLQRTLDAVRRSGLPWQLVDGGHPGMGDSIAAGVRATADAPGWLILPGDLPLIQAATLRCIAAAPAGLAVVVPLVQGQRGHPVRFSANCGPELMGLTGAQGAAALACVRGAAEWPLEDLGCIFDIDTLQDLQQAEHLLAMGTEFPG